MSGTRTIIECRNKLTLNEFASVWRMDELWENGIQAEFKCLAALCRWWRWTSPCYPEEEEEATHPLSSKWYIKLLCAVGKLIIFKILNNKEWNSSHAQIYNTARPRRASSLINVQFKLVNDANYWAKTVWINITAVAHKVCMSTAFFVVGKNTMNSVRMSL